LRHAYEFSPEQTCMAFSGLLGLPNVRTVSSQSIQNAIEWHSSGMDFADALHLSVAGDCRMMMSFDKKFIKTAKAVSARKISEP